MPLTYQVEFEPDFTRNNPPEVWRVLSVRNLTVIGKKIRHTNWFATKKAALLCADWIKANGGEVISIAQYLLENELYVQK